MCECEFPWHACVVGVIGGKQLVSGSPISSLIISVSALPFPPAAPKHTRRRRGLSRRGTCGCHLMREKQVEMKGSSRVCQSTSGLLSITPLTFRVCVRVSVYQQLTKFVCVHVCVWQYAHIKSLTHRECIRVCAYVCSSVQGV